MYQQKSEPGSPSVLVDCKDELADNAIARPAKLAMKPAPAPWRNYLLFILCASLYLLPFMRIIMACMDEGSFLCGAVRIIHGQVFARDFFEVMGPGSFYSLAVFFKVFGATFLASRIWLFVSSLGTALSIYFLTNRICGSFRTLPCLIVAGTSFGAIWPGISHHVDSNFLALLAIIGLVLWYDRPRTSLLIVSGVLAGATTCVFQPKGALLVCAFAVWIGLYRRNHPSVWLSLGMIVGGFLAVIGAVAAYFWNQGALGSLIYANFVFPHLNYGSVNTIGYAHGIYENYWNVWVKGGGGTPLIVGMAAVLIAPFLFVAALPVLMVALAIRYRWKFVTPDVALYWLCGWALWLSEFHRRDIQHLVFGSALLIILSVKALSESRRKFVQAGLGILACSAMCLACFNCLVALDWGLHPSATRVGKISVIGRETILKLLNRYVRPGEETLIYPYSPAYYFLSATTNPTRYSFLLFGYNTPAQFREVTGILDQRRIRYVIWDSRFPALAADNFPGSEPRNSGDLIVEPYLESHYKLLTEEDGIRVMERKSSEPAN